MEVISQVFSIIAIVAFFSGFYYMNKDEQMYKIISWTLTGVSLFISIIPMFQKNNTKPENDTTTTTLVEERPSTTLSFDNVVTTTTRTTTTTEPTTTEETTYQNKYNYIVLQDNMITGYISSKNKELHQSYSPPKTGRYRLDFEISNVENNYYVVIKNSTGEEIDSAYYSDEGMTIKELKKNEQYAIIVKANKIDTPFNFTIKINLPDN